MNELQIFQNEQFGMIRTAGTAEEPLFCASDVCRALGYTNGRKAISDHCEEDDVTKRDIIDNLGRTQSAAFVNESGIYSLIFGSKLSTARQFKRWVTSEVLPAIRKTGSYVAKKLSRKELAQMVIQQEEEMEMLRLENLRKDERIEEQKPKVVFADAVAGSTNSILIGELAKILRQNNVDMGEKRLFQWLRDNGYLGTTGDRYNIPNQRYIEMGLFTLKTNTFSVNGTMKTRNTTKVTGKGSQYFINKFLNNQNNK